MLKMVRLRLVITNKTAIIEVVLVRTSAEPLGDIPSLPPPIPRAPPSAL